MHNLTIQITIPCGVYLQQQMGKSGCVSVVNALVGEFMDSWSMCTSDIERKQKGFIYIRNMSSILWLRKASLTCIWISAFGIMPTKQSAFPPCILNVLDLTVRNVERVNHHRYTHVFIHHHWLFIVINDQQNLLLKFYVGIWLPSLSLSGQSLLCKYQGIYFFCHLPYTKLKSNSSWPFWAS